MTNLLSKKERLIAKKIELKESWEDINVFISQYIEKLNSVVDAVIDVDDSVAFFQTYPKVSCNLDKILNIFVQVQCKLNIYSCEEIFSSDFVIKDEGTHIVKDNEPSESKEVCRQESDTEGLPVIKVGSLEQDLCDPSAEVCPAVEWVVVENCTPFADNNCETKKPIAGIVDQVSIAETFPVCDIKEDLKTECGDFSCTKRRITHCVIKPNEVLEMVYSHGDSPWNFWLCYYPRSDIEFIQESIRSLYCTNRLEVLSVLPEVGNHVLVADGKRFLRGQVLSVRGTELLDTTCVMLLDLDSGRMKSCKLKYIWEMTEELMSLQAQAVNCQLQGIEGDCSIWYKENIRKCHMANRFEELLLQTTLSVKFIRTLGDSSLPRYVIDADCINLETDKIYNVSQLVNDTIISVIMCKPDVEKCSQKDEASVLQDTGGGTSLSHDCETKQQTNEICANITKSSEYGADSVGNVGNPQQVRENCTDVIYQELNSPSSHCVTSIQRSPLYGTDTNINSRKVCDPDANCSEILSLCETLFSNVEDSVCEGSSRDIILQKINCSDLLNKTVLGVPTVVESPSLFCMQFILGDRGEFHNLHKKMCSFYSENKVKFNTKEAAQRIIKSYCAAMYPQDGKWYRAEIIDWIPSTATTLCVCYVDIGDKTITELKYIQPLDKQFARVPILSQRCHLYGVAPVETAVFTFVSYEWLSRTVSLFENIITTSALYTMQIKELTSYGSVGIVLIHPSFPDTSINEKLVTLGEAKYFLNEENLRLWDPMKDEYERFARHPVTDDNACIAVSGYSPNDEQRFCKFYAKHGRCFKGSNCRKEHVPSHPGGWISDKEEVFQNAFTQITLPDVGETVFIQVTCVMRINLFYIVLVEDNTGEETLLTLNRYINNKDNLKNLRKLEVTPAVGQLVLAHYHQDGIWYRARVIDTDNDNSLVQVFFVDYGNTEWVSEMHVCDIDPQYLHLPFQAIESSLAFADMSASVDDDSLETVISVFRCLTDCTQPLKAKIISKDDVLKKLELQLYDINDHDIALMLADTGYVNITSIQMTPAAAFGIPG